ncbi:ABC transporter permease [Pontibacter rugosus]
MERELPEVEKAVRYGLPRPMLLSHGEKGLKGKATYADPAFLEVFSFKLLEGDKTQVLKQPNSVVLSDSMAYKLLGSTDVVGQLIKLNNSESYKITGVMASVPENSTMQFDIVLPFINYERQPGSEWMEHWGNNGVMTYLLLKPGTDAEALSEKISPFVKQRYEESNVDLFLHPYADYHLHNFRKLDANPGQILYVRLFMVVALFLLLIACINFMNLATARSAKRAKEVGVRKAVGADKKALVSQFMVESVLVALIAMFLAMNFAGILLPHFNELTGKAIALNLLSPVVLLGLLGVALFTGIVAGSYPAFFLSSFEPVLVLKGTVRLNRGVATFRKGLVIFQFVLSALLIVCTLVVYLQMRYIQNRNIGINRDNLVMLPLEGKLLERYSMVKAEILEIPGVVGVSASSQNPISTDSNTGDVDWKGKEADKSILVDVMDTDYDFISLMGISLKEGRDFSKDFGTDTAAFIVNEEAVRQMNMKNPVGQWLHLWEEGHIVGVVKDFHTTSMHFKTKPLAMRLRPAETSTMIVRVAAGKTQDVMKNLERITRKHNPIYSFSYRFLDDMYNRMYRSEAVMTKLTSAFAGIAIFISCLGLFGLALFTAEQRTKEIGVRKVLGASVASIVFMLSKDFLLVLLANIIALPLSWYLMSNWLQGYAYRTEVSWWIFAVALLATVVIAMFTLSFHAIKTAIANPVNSLRSE